ncbi:MAG: ABC transporter ATP-binding protein [Pirellulales bacterium]|nr:ABC transporter ATP-binding protein [Pirellulales bacterium]
MSCAIRVENLTKQYWLPPGPRAPYRTLREEVLRWGGNQVRRLLGKGAALRGTPLVALRNVSFEVPEGQVTGIIGRNGAGKSTLLKILGRITRPTSGRALVRGRVGCLLEVGTGFHPELTGRENIYLNGVLLGMRRREVARKFDAIVAFAETERFLDLPVKHYSSGMYMRLAFAVAAHLDPEVLLVDEVLAVGDALFQKKCLGKMDEVARTGRTVLFVSHNMAAVKRLCRRAIVLRDGEVAADGDVLAAVACYQQEGLAEGGGERVWPPTALDPQAPAALLAVRVRDAAGQTSANLNSHEPFTVEIDYLNRQPGARLGTTLVVYNADNVCLFGSIDNRDPQWHLQPRPAGRYRSVCHVPADLFPDGRLDLSVLIWGEGYTLLHREEQCLSIQIHETEHSARGDYTGGMAGVFRPRLEWHTEFLGPGASNG